MCTFAQSDLLMFFKPSQCPGSMRHPNFETCWWSWEQFVTTLQDRTTHSEEEELLKHSEPLCTDKCCSADASGRLCSSPCNLNMAALFFYCQRHTDFRHQSWNQFPVRPVCSHETVAEINPSQPSPRHFGPVTLAHSVTVWGEGHVSCSPASSLCMNRNLTVAGHCFKSRCYKESCRCFHRQTKTRFSRCFKDQTFGDVGLYLPLTRMVVVFLAGFPTLLDPTQL